MKRQNQPDYGRLRTVIKDAKWAKDKGKKVKWGELKKALAIT